MLLGRGKCLFLMVLNGRTDEIPFPYCQGLGGPECSEDRESDAWGDQPSGF